MTHDSRLFSPVSRLRSPYSGLRARFRSVAIMIVIVAVIDLVISLLVGCNSPTSPDSGLRSSDSRLSDSRLSTLDRFNVARRYPFTGMWVRSATATAEGCMLSISEVGEIIVLQTQSETAPMTVHQVDAKLFELVITPQHKLRLVWNEPAITITPYRGEFALSILGVWRRRTSP